MKKIVILLLVVAFHKVLPAQNTNLIKDAKITFSFLSNEVDGSVSGFSSSSVIDLKEPGNTVLKGSVATETLKTGNFLRDWSLKGGKYFDTETYPKISFQSTSVEATDSGFDVEGKLTIKKTTLPIRISFIKTGTNLTGKTTINAYDYGIKVKKKKEDNLVAVQFVFNLK